MRKHWRLLLTGANDAFTNMAVDEAILRCVTSGQSPNTLRLYSWQPSAVSIGYFQGLEQEVDLAACEAQGVDVVRRLTGGGAVFHDQHGEVTYSLMIPDDYPGMPRKVLSSYEILCQGLILGLKNLGLDAVFNPINDILVNGKKISGNAQTRRFGGILQHGTILYDVNPHLMFTLLKVPNEKMRDKLIQGVEERVTSIKRELNAVTPVDVIQAMSEGFARALDVGMVQGILSKTELNLAEQLKVERYGNKNWTHQR